MNIDSAVLYKLVWGIGIMSVVLAAAVSAIFQLINGWRERLAADKRHLRDLALKAAIVQWEHDVAKNKESRGTLDIDTPGPLGETHFDMILIKKLKLVDMFSKAVSPEAIEQGMREMRRTQGALVKALTKTSASEEQTQSGKD